MTELSALAGSEGYAACDDEASVELSASGGQRGAERSAGLHRPLAAGGPYCLKRPSRPFQTPIAAFICGRVWRPTVLFTSLPSWK